MSEDRIDLDVTSPTADYFRETATKLEASGDPKSLDIAKSIRGNLERFGAPPPVVTPPVDQHTVYWNQRQRSANDYGNDAFDPAVGDPRVWATQYNLTPDLGRALIRDIAATKETPDPVEVIVALERGSSGIKYNDAIREVNAFLKAGVFPGKGSLEAKHLSPWALTQLYHYSRYVAHFQSSKSKA
jgi:hypothetical protein